MATITTGNVPKALWGDRGRGKPKAKPKRKDAPAKKRPAKKR